MFWVDLVIMLLGLSLIRVLVRRLIPKAHDNLFDILLFSIFLIGAVIKWRADIQSESDQQALEQRLRTAEGRTATLGERIRFRQLSESQIHAISDRLRQAPTAKIRMLQPTGDQEVVQLAEQLKQALEGAGWSIEQDLVDLSGTARFGLIVYASENPPNASVSALYRALQDAQLSLLLHRDVNLPPDVIGIQIGSKEP